MNEPAPGGERNEILSFPWPYRRIATEEAFSLPEVYEAMRGWAATADPAEPDQDFWDFVCTQDTPGLHRVRCAHLHPPALPRGPDGGGAVMSESRARNGF